MTILLIAGAWILGVSLGVKISPTLTRAGLLKTRGYLDNYSCTQLGFAFAAAACFYFGYGWAAFVFLAVPCVEGYFYHTPSQL